VANCPKFKYLVLFGDIFSLSVAFVVALGVSLPGGFWAQFGSFMTAIYVFIAYAFSLSLMVFIFILKDLYKPQTFRQHYRHLLTVGLALLFGSGLIFFAMLLVNWDFFSLYGRELLFSFVIIALILVAITRLSIVSMFIFRGGGAASKRRLLVVGGDHAARKAVRAIQAEPKSFLQIIGVVDDYKEPGKPLFDEWVNLGRLDEVPGLVKTLGADEILVAIDSAPYPRLVNVVEVCLEAGCVVRVYSDRLRNLANRIGADQYAKDLPVINLAQVRSGVVSDVLRRLTDVVVAELALTVLAPLFLGVAIGIKLSSPGPVIFRQTRIGAQGRPFEFFKFRSMHVGSSPEAHKEYVQHFIKGQAKGLPVSDSAPNVFKIADDPRTFPFGRFIRRTSIDEFPQLFNVLKGDMGLISPRPCLPYEWESYEEWHKQRLSVVPGCTGLWQVFGRSAVTFEEMVIMDLYYISNRSLVLDARILYKTISVILFGRGGF
jgi:undecaprenyl-phosphate galactose phosphotransferase